jgi:hypothetical protein
MSYMRTEEGYDMTEPTRPLALPTRERLIRAGVITPADTRPAIAGLPASGTIEAECLICKRTFRSLREYHNHRDINPNKSTRTTCVGVESET